MNLSLPHFNYLSGRPGRACPTWCRRLVLTLCLGWLAVLPALAAARIDPARLPVLGEQSAVSVLTMWPGNEIYIAFGHSAIRVSDPDQEIDIIFNYGTFDMASPLFVPRFVYGELSYFLSTSRFKPYLEYITRQQNVVWHEQVLDLDRNERNQVFRFLVDNAQEDNKYYLYDFILDNCATRVTDVFTRVLGGRLKLNPHAGNDYRRTFRQMLDEHVADRPGWQFLFYLVLGTAADQPVPLELDDWLPFHLKTLLSDATLDRGAGPVPLVKSESRLVDPAEPSYYGTPWLNPALVLWPLACLALGGLVLTIIRFRQGKGLRAPALPLRLLDFLLFFLVGLVGLIVWYLNFFSIHTAVKGNWNCLWLQPLHLVTACWFLFRRPRPWLGWVQAAAAGLTLLPLLLWPVWPQAMHPSMIPLMLLLAGRLAGYSLRAWAVTGRKYPWRS